MMEAEAPAAPARRKLRRILRLTAYNALFISIGLALIALGGEAYFRVAKPFMYGVYPREFVPGVGLLLKPDTEVRISNRLDFWTISHTNSLGFLDREPPPGPPPGCPVAVIGDSFVVAHQVPIADKFQVRLEQMAAAQLPQLNLTAYAFGKDGTGQVGQLAFYDRYARNLHPRLLVLVYVLNDVWNNHPVMRGIRRSQDPQHLPYTSVARRPDGTLTLRPPDPEYQNFSVPSPPQPPRPWVDRALLEASKISWFAIWLETKKRILFPSESPVFARKARAELLGRDPRYAPILEGTTHLSYNPEKDITEQYATGDLPPIYAEILEYNAFALAQYQERAARDGATVVILASHDLKVDGRSAVFDRIQEIAAAQNIPVIDQSDYILRQGAALQDAQFRHDPHWNPQGHQWAAEALLEWIRENQQVCRPPPP